MREARQLKATSATGWRGQSRAEGELYMREALREAKVALDSGDCPIGAVVVDEFGIAGRGRNRRNTEHFLMHAEIDAIRSLRTPFQDRSRTSIFTTVEPCYMCLGAILNARIGNIIYAIPDRLAGCHQIVRVGKYSSVRIYEVKGDILAQDSFELLYHYSPGLCRAFLGSDLKRRLKLASGEH